MTKEKYLNYRGDITAITSSDTMLSFVTQHTEDLPTALYRVDCEKMELAEFPLPCGGTAVLVDDVDTTVAGTDGRLYQLTAKAKSPKPGKVTFEQNTTALVALSDNRLAALVGSEIVVVDRTKAASQQTLELPEAGTAIAADPTGQYLVAGTEKGNVLVFDCADKDEFAFAESAKLHEGAVTALLFEPEELRFLSAGLDQKLLLTHALGQLQPEDRGRGGMHSDRVTALVQTPGDRFISGSADKSLKAWLRSGATRPATMDDGVLAVTDLATVTIHNRPHVVAACGDNTLRFWLLDAAGKIEQPTHKLFDASATAARDLQSTDATVREKSLTLLAQYNDAAALKLIAGQISNDTDPSLRTLATELLGSAQNPRAVALLEPCLKHSDEPVRKAALTGLRQQTGLHEIKPLALALASKQSDIGILAIQALGELAERDDLALANLLAAIDHPTWEIRRAAVLTLEDNYPGTKPESSLVAMRSRQSDVRRLALVRLFQRKLLSEDTVRSSIRRALEDKDAEVRQTAFLLSVLSRTKLAKELRERDAELDRQFFELENYRLDEPAGGKGKKLAPKAKGTSKSASKAKAKVKKPGPAKLNDDELEPLIHAMASRALDTSLLGGRCLALLHDPRAFGLLLQLSRENNQNARADVCRSLGSLGDQRSIDRLRTLLHDDELSVRDAAFTALSLIDDVEPIDLVAASFAAKAQEVRQRGLKQLVKVLKKSKPKKTDGPAAQLLRRALNDIFSSVRGEAFKTTLNLQLFGGNDGTLRFVLESTYADTRREVLTELMAQSGKPWAWSLLVEMLNDQDAQIRAEAFEFAVKKTKGRDYSFFKSALESKHVDTRVAAVQELTRKRTSDAESLLLVALDDESKSVRDLAFEAVVAMGSAERLQQAMDSDRSDVVVRAARALAKHGSGDAKATLLKFLAVPEPETEEAHELWMNNTTVAIDGLGELGDPTTAGKITPFLELQQHGGDLRLVASTALVGLADSSLETAPLREAMGGAEADWKLRSNLAFALLLSGDESVVDDVFAKESLAEQADRFELTAAFLLGPDREDRLIRKLDADDANLQLLAFLLLMLRELRLHAGNPDRCLAALSSVHPRIRLLAGDALLKFSDDDSFAAFILRFVNERESTKDWEVPAATVSDLAAVLGQGDPQFVRRTIALLPVLLEDKQSAWDHVWQIHAARFATKLDVLRADVKKSKSASRQTSDDELRQLAFGAWVGLIREQGSSDGSSANPLVARVRRTALMRLRAMAEADAQFAAPAQSVCVQAMGDPNKPVRMLAFETLQSLKLDDAKLASEAIEAGHSDLGVEGLKLLTGGKSKAAGRKVLEQVMLTRGDGLALEAARLLRGEENPVPVAQAALEAVYPRVHGAAVGWLVDAYDQPKAKKALHSALESRFQEVRMRTALELAKKKDTAAFGALVELLNDATEERSQTAIAMAIQQLGDPRGPDALIDRLEHDPTGTAKINVLLNIAGGQRLPETAVRLLPMLDDARRRDAVFNALVSISGFDQPIHDVDAALDRLSPEQKLMMHGRRFEGNRDDDWQQKQDARHDRVLADLLNRCLTLGDVARLTQLVPAARWSESGDVDDGLSVLAAHPDAALRNAVIEAIGWRVRNRNGSTDPLVRALEHRDATTKLFAAEALARSGNGDGFSILMSAIDLLPELPQRQRAVRALGELADTRSLDVLLKLAAEDGHALQETAAEAIGHLSQSDKADEILELLKRLASGSDGRAVAAVNGLRWFDSFEGWKVVRSLLKGAMYFSPVTSAAAAVLGHNDDPATRKLLLEGLSSCQEYSTGLILEASARRVCGAESVDPDVALVQSFVFECLDSDQQDVVIRRIGDMADAEDVLRVLHDVEPEYAASVVEALLQRDPIPVEAAQAAVASPHLETVAAAARLLGRSGAGNKTSAAAIETALSQLAEKTQQEISSWVDDRDELAAHIEDNIAALVRLVWAAGRLGIGEQQLASVVATYADESLMSNVLAESLIALSEMKCKKATLDIVESVAVGHQPELRDMALRLLSQQSTKHVAGMAPRLSADRHGFNLIAGIDSKATAAVVDSALTNQHEQPVVLPQVIAAGDDKSLVAIAADQDLSNIARLNAIEALARIGTTAAEKHLVSIAGTKDLDEELAKAAWRARRRSIRARTKEAQS